MRIKLILSILLLTSFYQIGYTQELQAFKLDSLWGYKNLSGDIIIKPQFQYARDFSGKYAVVAKNNKLGIIDNSNQIVIPFKYEYLRHLTGDKFIFGWRAKYFGEYKLGIINSQNKILIKPIYRRIELHYDILETVKQIDSIIGKGRIGDIRRVKWKHGLTKLTGEEILPNVYDYIKWIDESFIILTKGNRQALFRSNGTKLTDFDYIVIGEFKNGLSKVRKGDKYGFINKKGKLVIPTKFQMCYPFENGYSRVEINDKWGIINTNGDYIFEPEYTFSEMKEKIETL